MMIMIKKIIQFCVVLVLMLLTFVFNVSAATGKCGDDAIYTLENGVLTISGTGAMYDYGYVYGEGNSTKQGYGIIGSGMTSYGEYYERETPWLDGELEDESKRIYKVVVEEGITYIGINSFANQRYLKEVSLPSTLKGMGCGCFYSCDELTGIDIPDSVETLGTRNYDDSRTVFKFCSNLTFINISEKSNLKYIEDGAFFECGTTAGLEIFIPKHVEEIGDYAFAGYFKEISVSPHNEYYCSHDGVLYSKDMTTLVSYPMLKSDDTFKIPKSVTTTRPKSMYVIGIGLYDFEKQEKNGMMRIYIPDSIEHWAENTIATEYPLKIYFAGSKSDWNDLRETDKVHYVEGNSFVIYNHSGMKLPIVMVSGAVLVALLVIKLKRKKS